MDVSKLSIKGTHEPRLPKAYSVTQLKLWEGCPFQYYCKYVIGLKKPTPYHMVWGLAIHAGHECYWLSRVAGEEESQRLAVINKVFRAKLDDGCQLHGHEVQKHDIWLGMHLLEKYGKEYGSQIPLHREVEWKFDFGLPGINRPIIGRLDRLQANGVIVDVKTTGKYPAENAAEDDVQLITYALAVLKQYPRFQKMMQVWVCFEYFFRGSRLEDPQIILRHAKVTTEQREAVVKRFQKFDRAVNKAFDTMTFKAKKSYKFCDERWCDYWGVCPVRGGVEK